MTDFRANKKVIIFPIEIKSRDLIPRLEIAAKFVEKNYHVIVGEQTAIVKNIEKLPVGILFEKSISKLKEKRFKKFISLGFKICSLDEEGINAFHNPRSYKKSRFSYLNLSLASKIFVWGSFEKKIILQNKKFKKFKNKIINSGHNKIDLWIKNNNLFEKEQKKLKKKYGEYIFLVSNFAYPHRDGDEFLINISKKAGLLDNKKDWEILKYNMNYRKFVFKKYLKLIKKLHENFPNKKIILRPHPSENIKKWKLSLKKFQNVGVVYKYEISPWIKSCKYFIHSSCTTGLEAYFRGKKPISYLPLYLSKKNKFEKHISNSFSKLCRSENEIINLIKNEKKLNLKINTKKANIFPNFKNKENSINLIYENINKVNSKKINISFNLIEYFWQMIKESYIGIILKFEFFFDKNLKQKYYFRNDIIKIKTFSKKIKKNKIIFLMKNIFLIK